VNYEKIRLPKADKKKNSTNKQNLFKAIEKHSTKFDFVLCDEAHRLRNHNTQTHKGVKKILDLATSVVFLTATPIMISEQNLFNLLHLLDDQKYSEYSTFLNEIAVNTPFIRALTQINNNAPFEKIAKDLEESDVSLYYSSGEENIAVLDKTTKVKDLFYDIPLYKKIITDLTAKEDNPKNRVQLQFDISDMSEMNKIFSRTRKKEVTQDWSQAIREPHTEIIELYKDERKEFDKVIEEYISKNSYENEYGEVKMTQGGVLGLIQKKRQVASSVYAYLNRKEDLEINIDRFESYKDAKFEHLLKIINEVVINNNKKLIVFALFKNTLKYLNIRLKKKGFNTAIIHGDVEDRVSEINRFKTDDNVKILLSSEVGSEGLDMQFCDALVNYDLPWNPMVVEQRIGRIDRFGQKSPIVNIYNFVVQNSIQEDIYTRLLDRIGIFRGCIGDLEAILDKEIDKIGNIGVRNIREWFSSLEKELYCTKITKEQRIAKIEAIERAIITEQKNIKEISEGLTDTLTNDIYFKNEIDNIQNNHRYVTEKELVNYIRILIRTKLTTCNLETIDEEKLIYRFVMPQNSPSVLSNFLNQYQSRDSDSIISYHKFINSIRGESSFEITFSQETGYNDSKLIRINAYHTIITSAMRFFKEQESGTNNTFYFSLDKKYFDSNLIHTGDYFLAVYSSTIIKKWYNREQKTELLVPILFDVENDKVISDQKVTQRFLGEAQLNATAKSGKSNIKEDLITELEYIFAEELESIESQNLKEQRMRMETHKKMQIQRKAEFYDNRIQRQENVIRNSEEKLNYLSDEKERKNIESILPAQRKVLMNLREEKDNVIRKIKAGEIQYKSPRLISLSHVTIY
jgi:superfamily II DNA or RNA helicase